MSLTGAVLPQPNFVEHKCLGTSHVPNAVLPRARCLFLTSSWLGLVGNIHIDIQQHIDGKRVGHDPVLL